MILVLIPVIFEIAFVAILSYMVVDATHELQNLQRSKTILIYLQKVQTSSIQSIWLLSDRHVSYEAKAKELADLFKMLRDTRKWDDLLHSDPEAKALVDDMQMKYRALAGNIERGQKALRTSKADATAWRESLDNNMLMELSLDHREHAKKIVDLATRMLKSEPEQLKRLAESFSIFLCGGILFSIAISFLLLYFFTIDILRRLNSIADKSRLVASAQPLPPPDSGTDEIAELDRIICDAGVVLGEAQMKEHAIFESASEVICALDRRLKIETVSEASQKLWFYPVDQLQGRSLLSLVTANSIEPTRLAFDRIAEGKNEGIVETMMRCGDASFRTMLWSVRWTDEKQTFYCVVQDVTESKKIEKLKQHFLSMASHDMRSPLTAISMNISMLNLRNLPTPEGVKQELHQVEEKLENLIGLVNELLDLEKLEVSQPELTLRPLSASDVCEEAKEAVADRAGKAQVKFRGPRGDALVVADEKRLVQAVVNLLVNALKFSKTDSFITITIKTEDRFCIIEVAHQGYALSSQEAKLISDRFSQSQFPSGSPVKRAGLLLVTVRRITEMHGGTFGVNTTSGEGSTFWISIPLQGGKQE